MPLFTCWPTDGTMPGMSRSRLSAVLVWRSSTSASPMVVIGEADSMLGLRISVPVMTIPWPSCTLSSTATPGAIWTFSASRGMSGDTGVVCA